MRGLWFKYLVNFNSRAHVERDQDKNGENRYITISTHALTWSATCYHRSRGCPK